MSNITEVIANENYGITCPHEIMENGELRFRLRSHDGSAYIRTVSGTNGAWQNSHFHKSVKETYIVQKGWMGYACLRDKDMFLSIVQPGNVITIEPLVVHNIYLPAGAVIHTVKHGILEENDWFCDLSFDAATKYLSEDEMRKIAEKSL